MYQRKSESTETVLGYEITDRLSNEEMQQIIRELEGTIAEFGKIRVLIDLQAFPYGDLGALWEDLKFTVRHTKDTERLAVIGDSAWIKGSIRLFDALTATECRYFDHSEVEQAWSWLGKR